MSGVMRILAAIAGSGLVALVLADAFETIVVARRAQPIFRITRLFYSATWAPVAATGRRIRSGQRRERYLGLFGPLSLLMLTGSWAAGLIVGFALLQWTAGLQTNGNRPGFGHHIYFSATTFFTLAFAEPSNPPSRLLMVVEAALGYSFLGLVIGYPPLLYQHFRLVRCVLPSSTLALERHRRLPRSSFGKAMRLPSWRESLAEWEEWEAEVLQNHLSYPMLAYFRSQHTNQSWLAALTAIVDASALVFIAFEGDLKRQARFTFAMGRHALVDLAMVFGTRPVGPDVDRLSADDCARLRKTIAARATVMQVDRITDAELKKLRASYEPYAHALSQYFLTALPPWIPIEPKQDNWQRTAWDRTTPPFAVSDRSHRIENQRPVPESVVRGNVGACDPATFSCRTSW
jgi:hypothetical protein